MKDCQGQAQQAGMAPLQLQLQQPFKIIPDCPPPTLLTSVKFAGLEKADLSTTSVQGFRWGTEARDSYTWPHHKQA